MNYFVSKSDFAYGCATEIIRWVHTFAVVCEDKRSSSIFQELGYSSNIYFNDTSITQWRHTNHEPIIVKHFMDLFTV